MASSPGFAATVQVGSATAAATAATSLTNPNTNNALLVTSAAAGTRIDEIRYQALGTTVAGLINLFVYDGATYHLIDQVTVSAITVNVSGVTPFGATSMAWQTSRQYQNLVLKSGWSLYFTQSVAGNVSLFRVTAFGADY